MHDINIFSEIEISVIIPTYKPGDYIWQCLASLYKQTLSKKCFEVIIVLNGCDNPYLTNIKKYIENDSGEMRVKLLHIKQGGVSNARNIGLTQASGKYIVFIDDDDWVSECYLENLLKYASANGIVVANVRNYDENTGCYINDYLANAFRNNMGKDNISLLSGRSFFSNCPCKIIPMEIIGNHRFDSRFSQSEDAIFMAIISKHVENITLAEEKTIYYRRTRSGSVRHTRPKVVAFVDATKVIRAFIKIYLSDINHYNFTFFVTRILGVIKNIFRKK